MDFKLSSMKDVKIPWLYNKVNDGEDDYEPQKTDQETLELEIDTIKDNLKGKDYFPVYKEELIDEPVLSEFEKDPLELTGDANKEENYEQFVLIDEPVLSEFEKDPLELKGDANKEENYEQFVEQSKGVLNYRYQSGNKDLFKEEIKSEEPQCVEMCTVYEEEFSSIPFLTDKFERDPLELTTDLEEDRMGEELKGYGDALGEDIMERIFCDICNEYSRVTEFSFRHKLQSFCDTCYHSHLRMYKSEWMDVMYEWYESCMICMNVVYNSLDMVKHDCTCKNVFYCNICNLIVVKKEDIERHKLICVNHSSSLNNLVTRKSVVGRTGVAGKSGSESYLPKAKRYMGRCKGELVDNIKKKIVNTNYKKKMKNKSSCVIKRYKCNFCDGYFSSSYLKLHLRTHTGEKPSPCKLCKNSFSVSSILRSHLLTQTGEKPYPCKLCKKSFSESSNLKKHLRTHTGEKPFPCKLCKKSFA